MITHKIDIFNSEFSFKTKEYLKKIALSDSNLLIWGPSGSGKELWVDYFAKIKGKEILEINCSQNNPSLLEAHWFGYKKGAFTGAKEDKKGLFSLAKQKIIYLNGVEHLDHSTQTKLLRVVENKTFLPLGALEEIKLKSSFIFSSSKDLTKLTEKKQFREELYFRISVFSLFIPPLFERKEDINSLIKYFWEEKSLNKEELRKVKKTLINYNWPGNIREIENLTNNLIFQDNYKDFIENYINKNKFQNMKDIFKRDLTLEELEKQYILFLKDKYKNKEILSTILGISRKTLYNKLKKYDKD